MDILAKIIENLNEYQGEDYIPLDAIKDLLPDEQAKVIQSLYFQLYPNYYELVKSRYHDAYIAAFKGLIAAVEYLDIGANKELIKEYLLKVIDECEDKIILSDDIELVFRVPSTEQ